MMQNNNKSVEIEHIKVEEKGKRPNESTGLNIDEHLKIFDPNTKDVYLEKRG